MRVAYRESVAGSQEIEICLDKAIGGSHMFAKLKLSIESTLEDYDMNEIQKKRFESGEGDEVFEVSEKSFNLEADNDTAESANLASNQVSFDFLELEPVAERVKLDGDEYDTGNRR